MNRQTQHVLLALLGGALLRIAADDTFLRYVRPGHRPLLVAAGAVMVVLAGVAAIRDLRARVTESHDHGAAPWLLLLPVLAMAVVAPPALGADAVARAGPVDASAMALPPLPADPVVELGLGEFVQRAVWDAGGTVVGRQVALTGFAVPRADGFELARLTIRCCAADARVHRVRLEPAPGAAADTWLRVEGRLRPGPHPDGVPTIEVTSADRVAPPRDPYEY
ncbi:TIGR03943 family putative permease subunit [Pseudonocardia sp. CA-107938]|uniref:TIGR03943 family putative permease subunit n=1 Tax=Pseudonocardia sp. CA-107938 TaxID=3240021 RepID=UPI003D8B2FDE